MTDTEKMREVSRLQAELNAADAEHAAKVKAIREQINALCGLSCGRTRKQRSMSSADFLALGRVSGGRRERVA